jgi:hypothetical protein
MTNYVKIDLTDLSREQSAIVNAVIHEGEMRQTDKFIALLERKITEAYADNNRELIDFLENLIIEIESS